MEIGSCVVRRDSPSGRGSRDWRIPADGNSVVCRRKRQSDKEEVAIEGYPAGGNSGHVSLQETARWKRKSWSKEALLNTIGSALCHRIDSPSKRGSRGRRKPR